MASVTKTAATLDDLHCVEGKAVLIAGRIVHLIPTAHTPNHVAAWIYRSLDDHAEATGLGIAYTDNMGFAVPELSSERQPFSPDASYYLGPLPKDDMGFVEGPPTFAVEVRSKVDYGDSAEAAMAAKRTDYFEAGTAVIWDDLSPFPGMNPFLEQDDAWLDFHEKIIPIIAERLVIQVRPEYIVKIDEHIYVHELPVELRRYLGRADVFVPRSEVVSTTARSGVSLLEAPTKVQLPDSGVPDPPRDGQDQVWAESLILHLQP